jgi:hypothetical protein
MGPRFHHILPRRPAQRQQPQQHQQHTPPLRPHRRSRRNPRPLHILRKSRPIHLAARVRRQSEPRQPFLLVQTQKPAITPHNSSLKHPTRQAAEVIHLQRPQKPRRDLGLICHGLQRYATLLAFQLQFLAEGHVRSPSAAKFANRAFSRCGSQLLPGRLAAQRFVARAK